jgi:predicted CoA-binding protein
MKKDAKVIFSPQLANYLLMNGYTIIKLKPKHNKPDETVFVFRLDEGLYDAIEAWMAQEELNGK